ncbi:probable calcium-binding protein cml44 [Phtheirospermum japonicum]|uniref:Probable calcium-binding protein cml44 n=1 Tax=Phtheirospermum japonicum TaxID=374723 RepID=A0A830B0Y5_9LAMI|nr:probable calcium-binding protein cml44 [Phtheirospermum japonicum]
MSTFNTVHLSKIFNKLDRDGDGLVSVDELLWLLDAFSVRTNRDELELLVGGKSLSYADFMFFYETLIKGGDVFEHDIWEIERDNETLENDLRKAFRVFDLDEDGFISCEDLRMALSRLGLWDEKYGQDCKGMIGVYDTNSDGLLDFEEFKNMMLVTG